MKNILSFIEEIMVKYDLEKEFIENDTVLKNKLLSAKNLSERVLFKFFYSNKIINYRKQGLPLDIPSMKLKYIIDDLIDQKIFLKDTPLLIEKDLEVSSEIAKKIAEEIEKNKELIDEINTIKPAEIESDSAEKELLKTEKNSTKSIGYELLK
jgi:hypothetical protein